MFKVFKETGELLGMVATPNYIKVNEKNGCFNSCPENEATGISFNSTPYHLTNKDALISKNPDIVIEDVNLVEVDAGAELHNTTTITQEQYEILSNAIMELAEYQAELEMVMMADEGEGI